MQFIRRGDRKGYYKVLLLLVYLPFLIIQSTYRFYVVASFFSYPSPSQYNGFNNVRYADIQKQNSYSDKNTDNAHLSLDKRYHHKSYIDTDAILSSPQQNQFSFTGLTPYFLSALPVFTSPLLPASFLRGPPCA